MSPDQVSFITTIAALVEKVGTLPLATIFILLQLGPWIAAFILTRAAERNAQKRLDEAIRMYENSNSLVKDIKAIADGLQSLVILNTQTMQGVKDSVDNNLFCPLARKKKKLELEVG